MAEVTVNKKKLLCVEHPAVVKNKEKMLETLGGEDNVGMTYSDPNHRLEIRFRPDDVNCKPAFGDRHKSTSLLMRVKKKKLKPGSGAVSSSACEVVGDYAYRSEIVGIVDTTYKFQSLVDFQYLPMGKVADGNYDSFLKQCVPQTIESLDWLKGEAPLFILPPIFSRMDTQGDYQYRRDPQKKVPLIDERPANLVACTRQRRTAFAHLANFDDKEMPKMAHPEAMEQLKTKFLWQEMTEAVQKLFQERPIWSKNALMAKTRLHRDKLKCVLPVCAYYFVNGPWRGLWTRLGYNPREDPDAVNYQLVDFRLRQSSAAKSLTVSSKRSAFDYVLPNKVSQQGKRIATIQTDTLNLGTSTTESDNSGQEKLDATYRFKPGILPPFRQMFYQYCDVEEPTVQQLLAKSIQKSKCHERNGWLKENIHGEVRAILSSHVQKVVHQQTKDTSTTPGQAMDTAEESDDDDDDGGSGLENEMETELLDYM